MAKILPFKTRQQLETEKAVKVIAGVGIPLRMGRS